MYLTPTIPMLSNRRNGAPLLPAIDPMLAQAERVVEHFDRRGVLRLESRAASHLRSIFATPPEALRVNRMLRRIGFSRHTLGRDFRVEGLPSCHQWIVLARALYAHRIFVRGGPLWRAAYTARYPDPYTMSNVFHRITGFRPSILRDVDQEGLLDLWIARQRARGTLTGPPPATPRTCPICGGPGAC